MTSESEIEQEIQEKGLNAPRLTPELIDSVIKDVAYHVFSGSCLTVCCITLKNGFTVSGESACASPENFNKEIGEKISFTNARDKIWMLEGYLLKDKLANPLPIMSAGDIACVAHAINRAYCQSIGDDSQPEWENAPEWQKESAINGVKYHQENPDADPRGSHENWLKEKEADGWVYGEVKDPDKKEHPCCVPYDDLPTDQKAKDYLFRQVIHSLSN